MAGEKITLEPGFASKFPKLKPVGLNTMDNDMGNGVCMVEPPNPAGLRRTCIGGTLRLRRVSTTDWDEFEATGFSQGGAPDSCVNCVIFQRANGIEPPSVTPTRNGNVSSTIDAYLKETL